jgi:hypothetical protein
LFAGKPQVVLTEKLADMTSVLLILGRNRHILSIAPQLMIQACAKGDISAWYLQTLHI